MFSFYGTFLGLGIFLSLIVFFLDDLLDFEGPFNLTVVITWITVFGGAGLLFKQYSLQDEHMIFGMSLLIGLTVSQIFYFAYIRPMKQSENSISFSRAELVGRIGEMITPVSEDKYGEVILLIGASYVSYIAQSETGHSIRKGTKVVVKKVKGHVVFVTAMNEGE